MSTDTKTGANWIKSFTAGPSLEIKISDKGFVGFFNNGRWANGVTAETFSTLINNPESLTEAALFATSVKEQSKPKREQEKLDAKLRKEAEALLLKAEKLREAGIDFATILAKKQA